MNKQNNSNGQQIHDFMLFTTNYPIYLSSIVGRVKAH